MKYLLIISLIFLISFSSASTYIDIYLKDDGSAILTGTTNLPQEYFPNWILVENGKISSKTDLLTYKSQDKWTLYFSFNDSVINAHMPKNSVVFDTNGKISTSSNLLGENLFLINSENSIEIEYSILDENLEFNLLYLLFFILIITLTLFFIYRKNLLKKQDKIEIISSVLNERSNQIIKILKEKGKIKSSSLRKLTNIPKASFSRHIHDLVNRKVISLSGEGKNKFIELKK